MSQKIVTQCDGCEKEVYDEHPHGWLKLEISVEGIGESKKVRDIVETVWVCSNECLVRYAEKKVNS